MNKFQERHELSKLNQEDTKYLNRTITSKKIYLIIKMFLTEKSPSPDNVPQIPQTFQEELTPHKLF